MLELLICKNMSFENNIYSEINGFLIYNISKHIPYVQILRLIGKEMVRFGALYTTIIPATAIYCS